MSKRKAGVSGNTPTGGIIGDVGHGGIGEIPIGGIGQVLTGG